MAGNGASNWGRRVVLLVVFLGVCAAGGWYAYRTWFSGTEEAPDAALFFKVAQGPLTISVTEAGTVKPREQEVIKSMLEGRTTILYLVPEGKRVDKGDLLVELDASSLLDEKVDQEIRVQNADASFVQAREGLEVAKNQAQSDVEKAELTLRFAKEDLEKYKEGEYPNELKVLEAKITLAKEELQRANEKLDWSKQLFNEKYLSATELQADELAAQKTKLDLELAENNLSLFKEYTYKRNIAQLSADVKQAEMALERVKRKASADVVQAEAQLRARESEFKRQKDKLDKIIEQIGKAKIVAPTDGLVVYATSAQFSWRGNVEPLAEGQEVRERQELIYLPTADTFIAEVKIHESSLKKVYVGLPVRLMIDALPGTTFTGKVSKIAPLPDPQSMFMNPDLKVYDTEIEIQGGGDVLRTGMSCQAEIIVAQYDDAVYVPVQSVIRIGRTPTVFVKEGTTVESRKVEIGLDNNRMVRVISGLKPGEEVLMTPPLDAGAAAVENDDTMEKVDIPERPVDTRRTSGGRGTGGGTTNGAPGQAEAAQRAPQNGEAQQENGQDERRGRPNMSPEERAKLRERMEKMTPEEREAMRRRFREQGQRGGQGRPRSDAQGRQE
jgi:HlyD family secretion protein